MLNTFAKKKIEEAYSVKSDFDSSLRRALSRLEFALNFHILDCKKIISIAFFFRKQSISHLIFLV